MSLLFGTAEAAITMDYDTLILSSLGAVGPFVEGGPRIISLSHSLDVGAVARPSVMEATRRQRFLKQYMMGPRRGVVGVVESLARFILLASDMFW